MYSPKGIGAEFEMTLLLANFQGKVFKVEVTLKWTEWNLLLSKFVFWYVIVHAKIDRNKLAWYKNRQTHNMYTELNITDVEYN